MRIWEGLLFGLASGPSCLASCLPVVLPWLAARHEQTATPAPRLLAEFLAGRLAGYLAFAALAWSVGLLLPAGSRLRAVLFGIVHLGVAAALIFDARARAHQCFGCQGCVTAAKRRTAVPAVLGLLTGLNLCPPFLAAGVRAAQGITLSASLVFFAFFFAGTTAWFLPLAGVRWLPRTPALATVARYTVFIMAAWFAYLGVAALGGGLLHGK